jgi:NAD(P)-dependent dehydrogenase (short-subunit alcohol dehydrogenase family)
MKIEGSVALVTGANRGLGAAFCRTLLERGAAKVYAGARDLHSLNHPGVDPVQLDVTSATDIAAAAASYGDITLLINNAGIGTGTSGPRRRRARRGPPRVRDERLRTARPQPCIRTGARHERWRDHHQRSLGPVMDQQPTTAIYCASKAAGWSLTNSLRQELRAQHTQVLGLYVGYMDTDMTAGITAPKSDPVAVAHQTLDGVETGAHEVLADDISRHVRSALSGDLLSLYPQLAG